MVETLNGYPANVPPSHLEGDAEDNQFVRQASRQSDGTIDDRSCAGSFCSSRSGNPGSSKTGDYSAHTAPPQYRNSGAFVHGTKFKNFTSIMKHGMKAADREIYMIDEVKSNGRVPGMTERPEILIFIDEHKARSENMIFDYDARQGTWKTKGINGVIRPWFFQKVVDQRPKTRGNVLFQSKQDPMMLANVLKRSQLPKRLIHATYWENIYGIMNEGLKPGKNPIGSTRQPFKELVQDAENIVYTVNMSASRKGSKADSLTSPLLQAEAAPTLKAGEPEMVPEMLDGGDTLDFTVTQEDVGMERPPDAFIVIDPQKAEEYGLKFVQSADRGETVFITGSVPREAFERIEVNEPIQLPDSLKAKIVDPKSFEDIPIIDISGNEADVIEQLRYACEVVGFMQIRGHGVPEELMAAHMELQKQFFALPQESKDRLKLNDDCPVRGYFGKGGENLDKVLGDEVDAAKGQEVSGKGRKDNKEALDTNGVPWAKPNGGYVANVFGMPSRLPPDDEVPRFQEILEEYSRHMFSLSQKLLSLMAQVLGLPKDFFAKHLDNPVATHRLLHYWPLTDVHKTIGVGEHTDYGLLTILKQDSTGGLQVLNAKDMSWVHCCPIEDAFVVNLGDMLQRWTDNRFKSTVHRVVNLSRADRYSVPYFLEPNMDSVIFPGELIGAQVDGKTPDTSEDILGRFYRASGQLKAGAPK
jgi:isopenicillin N synthase-like dioxygenase/RNA:NAD 2'-phosphotransferase (TPT1/KptA family)